MCESVPQMPTAATRTSTWRDEICGRGTSLTSSRPTSTNTVAFIVLTLGEVEPFSNVFAVFMGALTRLPRQRAAGAEFHLNVACVQASCVSQFSELLHRFTDTDFQWRCWEISNHSPDRSII